MSAELRWKIILFDMDGTLVDSAKMVTNRFAETFTNFGIQVPEAEELHGLVGPSAANTMLNYLGEELAPEGIAFYRELAKRDGSSGLSLFFGIRELITSLHLAGIQLGVATSKPELEAIHILKHLEIEQYFSVVSGASDIEGIYSKTDVISRALSRFSPSTLDEVVMIGDRIFDVEGAEACNLESIFVTWGGANVKEGTRSLFVVNSPEKLKQLLLSEH